MSNWKELGVCPNAHGPLVIFKKPPSILYLLSEDLCDVAGLMGTETPEDMFGHIVAVCRECGFVATTSPTHEYNYVIGEWEIPETEEDEESQASGDSTQ